MSQELSVFLSLQTAAALEKLNGFLGAAGRGLAELAAEAAAAYISFEGLRKLDDAVREAINLEEAIGRLSQKTGLSIPLLAEFKEKAGFIGIEFEKTSLSLRKF